MTAQAPRLPHFLSEFTMFQLLSSLLLVALAASTHPPIYKPSSHFSNPSSRVVNGVPVEPHNKYPWQVALTYEENGYLYFLCGGFLIDTDWVVTAGHCIIDENLTYWPILGVYNLSAISETAQFIPAKQIIKHPGYNEDDASEGNDIALLKLSWSAELTDDVYPACLLPADCNIPDGTECYVTGWGYTSTDGPISDVLLEGLLCVLDHEHCSQPDYWGGNVKECQLCAGDCGSSACYGDSGGPLNCPGEYTEWKVCGIVSFGSSYGCNYPKKPTVFTCVGCFIDWIEEVTGIDLKKWCNPTSLYKQ